MSVAATEPGVSVRVPAKINLELVVGPRRDDGYHDLSTVFHAVSLYDIVTVSPAPQWAVTVSGPFTDRVPTGPDNLALAAARLLARESGLQEQVHIHIAKDIPVAAGLAGGSADAAGALVACDSLWGLDSPRELLDDLAGRLGSDITFALTGGTAMGAGRGERVAPVLGRGRYHWVLVVDDGGLSTPAVFAECDRLRGEADVPAPQPSARMMAALREGTAQALGAALDNDLQQASVSLAPHLAEVLEAGRRFGALGGLVSGSGPTVAFLVDGPEGALDLAVALTASGTAGQVRRAVGPVHGAHVVPGPTRPGLTGHPARGRSAPGGAGSGRENDRVRLAPAPEVD